jgi:hypothetical protein
LPVPADEPTSLDAPGWFVIDEWLVIEDGAGRLCGVEVMLDCGAATGNITAITSSNTERVTWMPPPLIVHIDEAGSVDSAVPPTGVFPTSQPTVVEAGPSCGAADEATVRVRFSAPGPVNFVIEVNQGDNTIGTAIGSLPGDLPWKTVSVPLTRSVDIDDPLAQIVVRAADGSNEQLAVGTVDFRLDRRDFGCPF